MEKAQGGTPRRVGARSKRGTLAEFLSAAFGTPPRPGEASAPKHVQLSTSLQAAIANGTLRSGDKLPTEVELVRLTPFSLGTVQRAIRSLVSAGLIERKQRLGTFVANDRKPIHEPLHLRFLDDDGKSVLPAFPRVVGRHLTGQRGPWNHLLKGDQAIRIDRLVNVNDEFLAYSRFFVDAARFPGLLRMPLRLLHGANFRVLLGQRFGVFVSHVSHKVSIRETTTETYRKIRVPPGTPCLCVEILARAGDKDDVYYQELTIPPSNRKLFLP